MTTLDQPEQSVACTPGRRLSDVLQELKVGEGERVSVGDIVHALKDRSFTPLMVIFAAPNVFLFIPGSAIITGLPLMLLAVQLILGRPNLWLPRFLAIRSIERSTFARIVAASTPYVLRIERLAKPRWWPPSHRMAEQIIGLTVLVLAVFLFLPIPLSNGLPALSVIMLALALGERDGFWLTGGLAVAIASIVLVGGMVSIGILAAVEFLFG